MPSLIVLLCYVRWSSLALERSHDSIAMLQICRSFIGKKPRVSQLCSSPFQLGTDYGEHMMDIPAAMEMDMIYLIRKMPTSCCSTRLRRASCLFSFQIVARLRCQASGSCREITGVLWLAGPRSRECTNITVLALLPFIYQADGLLQHCRMSR